MTEIELNNNDKLLIKADIKISMMLVLIVTIGFIILIGLILGIMFIFGTRPSDGFMTRCLKGVGLLFMPFLGLSWPNILKYIDLKKGKKLIIETDDYEVINKKDTAYILTHGDNKQKIQIDNRLIPLIKSSQPLTMEISRFAKSLLYISQDTENLLNKLNNDDSK